MSPRLELKRDAADAVVYEESPNYPEAFIIIGIGVLFAILGAAGQRFGASAKLQGKLDSGALCFFCLSTMDLVGSTISLSRDFLTVRRCLLGIRWSHRYPIVEIEEFFEGDAPREKSKKALGVQFVNARTARVALYPGPSFTTAEALLNERLKQFRRHGGVAHGPMTDDERWFHEKTNASVDLRRHAGRTLYLGAAIVLVGAALYPFFAGQPLHRYWQRMNGFLFLELLLWMVFVLEVALTLISWRYVRDLKKIDKDFREG